MPIGQLLKADIRFTLFSNLFNTIENQRGKKTAFNILESAIKTFGTHGLKTSTINKISMDAGVSPTTLLTHFSSKDILFESCIKYTRYLYQLYVVEEVDKQSTGSEKLKAYMHASVSWPGYFPNNLKFWLSFMHELSLDKELIELNKRMVETGTERVEQLVQLCIKEGSIMSSDGLPEVINNFLTGYILNYYTTKDKKSKKIDKNFANSLLAKVIKH